MALPASSFEDIRKKHLQKKSLWEDPDFPAEDSSIYFSRNPPYRLKWLRPYEISQRYGVQPEFFYEGGSRFDLVQGELGDCWVLASAVSVVDNRILFERLVPPNQSFRKDWYAGVFRFNFWRYGTWVEVCVDDRLPTLNGKLMMVQSTHVNEFWGALLEKAYAKLHGSYEAIKAGSNPDSLMDFTGGLVESFDLRQPPPDLPRLFTKAAERGSVITASIWGDATNNPVDRNGLVSGHAYSITRFMQVKKQTVDEKEFLLRVRNPWGSHVEWNGRWSDSSAEWRNLSSDVRRQMGLVMDSDGEFWLSLSDFVRNFDSVEICNLTADSLREPKKTWAVSLAHSKWKRDVTAGGRPELPTFWKNPQFQLKVEDHDEDDDKLASFIVELLQKDRRRRRLPYLAIGFVVYRVPSGAKLPLDRDHLSRADPVGAVKEYVNSRMVVRRFKLQPGSYVVIPTTWAANEEGDFMLRVFSEAASNISNEIPSSS